jgi:putative transposase
MPTGLRRYQQTTNFHFITFSCYRRKPFLEKNSSKDTVEEILEKTRQERGLCIAAYVLMPEHLHLLTDEPVNGTLATFIQIFKQRVSRRLKPASEERFWTIRYYDFNVHNEEKRIEKMRYIHRNPVKRGLAAHPEDYRWSSFNHYATGARGIVEIESEWTARRREPTSSHP